MIEQKALALLSEIQKERHENGAWQEGWNRTNASSIEAICRAIEQHEAFKQEVSDEIQSLGPVVRDYLGHFIIPKPKPDPIAEAWIEATGNTVGMGPLNEALEARGLEIREISK
jgi:hypothetical protein